MVKKCLIFFQLSLIALGVSALCLLGIPVAKHNITVQYMFAGMFWLTLIAESVLIVLSNNARKQIEKMNPHMKRNLASQRVGLLCFLQNREAKVVDLVLLASILVLIATRIFEINSMWLVLLGILSTYVSFHLHCIFNGILYKSIKYYQKIIHKRRERE